MRPCLRLVCTTRSHAEPLLREERPLHSKRFDTLPLTILCPRRAGRQSEPGQSHRGTTGQRGLARRPSERGLSGRRQRLDATIEDDTNFDDAILCRTLMPNGEIDDSGCDEGTRCCPAPEECEDQPCVGCTNRFNDECSVIGFPAAFCCEPMICTPTLVSPFYTRCQVPCTSDAICQNVFGGNSHCAVNLFFCPYIGPCCSKP